MTYTIPKDPNLAPSPFKLGEKYLTLAGDEVVFVHISNEQTTYETMCCDKGIHRYTRRDYGRCTGTDHNNPDPLNVRIPHHIYTNQDSEVPHMILDRNGEVVLDLCKRCGRAEAELDQPCEMK